MNPAGSDLDPGNRPSQGKLRFHRDADRYTMYVEGVTGGKHIVEPPVTFILDGNEHPLAGAPDLVAISTRPEPNTIAVEGRRGNAAVGWATYVVSSDGSTLTATIAGTDTEHRPYRSTIVWVRG
jgi:hypothetical protein